MLASCYIGWRLIGTLCVRGNGFVTFFWPSSAAWYINKYLIFHSPTVLSIADGHRKNACLTGYIWVNRNCLSHVFSIVFHHSFSVCHPAPLLQWTLCLSDLCRCCYSWNSSFLLNNVHNSKVSHALHSNPIPLYASVWVCGNSERLLLVRSDMGHAES